MGRTILLIDGYNGHTMRFFKKPINKGNSSTVFLRCAEIGKTHLIKWVHSETYKKALNYEN